MTEFSDERGAELRQIFFESAQELLQALNEAALNLERYPDDLETVRGIRRTVHTLKGDAAACGFRELSELAHQVEDVLGLEHAAASDCLAEVAFTAADAFQAMLVSYRGNLVPPSAEPLRQMLRDLVQEGKAVAAAEPGQKTIAQEPVVQTLWSDAERLAIANALRQGRPTYRVKVQLDPLCAMPIAARQLLYNALSAVGQVLAAPESSLPSSAKQLIFALACDQPAAQIAARCRIPTITSGAAVDELAHGILEPEDKAAANQNGAEDETWVSPAVEGEPAPKTAPGASVENTLRVDARRIDNLLNLVGELIIGKSMLQQILVEFSRRHPKDPLRAKLADSLGFQSRILTDLQHSVMKVRMVPVEQLFRRFPRVVRDVARRCGKQAELEISGQDTDLDRSLLDAIAEPLTHLIRNAVSHGIEPAEDRVENNKGPFGIVRLDAFHEGNQVVVEVGDDGRGIDLQRVRAKAVEQRLITLEESAALNEAGTLDLLFRPGFSTSDQVNEISGRGVGLDVVRSVLQRLKGTVEIVSLPGRGTTFRLKLPLTLAIIKGLLFRVEGRLYAIPLNAVDEIARARESELHRVNGQEVLQLRGQALQLVRLGRMRPDLAKYPHSRIFILVVAGSDRKLGLIVDALEGEEELVIKALDDQTVDTELVSGASILGDGRVVLILNLARVVERSSQLTGNEPGGAASGLLLLHAEKHAEAATTGGGRQ